VLLDARALDLQRVVELALVLRHERVLARLERHSATLEPGKSAKLTVTLKKGSYEFYCPVDGHKDKGMKTEIEVGGSGGGDTGTPDDNGGY